MNPAELRMVFMNPYGSDRMALDDAASFYGQPTVGLSVMDDISHQPGAGMDLNPMMGIVGGEYSGHQGASSIGMHTTPTTIITTSSPTNIYGLAQTVGGIHPVLHHATAYQAYHELADDDDTDPNETSQYVQTYDQIDDNSCYDSIATHDSSNTLTDDHKGIINIDDFVMMSDSNSYQDDQMMDDISIPDQHKNTQTIAQQTHPCGSQKRARKIEPVKRPGLILKTPIAYQGNIDPSVIPIQRDGMAVCERCGAIGVRHTFYTKSRRFCSMACARGELYTLAGDDNNKSKGVGHTSTTSLSGGGGSGGAMGTGAGGGTILGSGDGNSHLQIGLARSGQSSHINNKKNLDQNNIGSPSSLQGRTDLELEFRVSHIRKSNYRFKMSDDSSSPGAGRINGENGNGFGIDTHNTTTGKPILYRDVLPQDEVPQILKIDRLLSPCPQDDKIISVRRKPCDYLNSFDWTPELMKADFFAAPVTCFQHAPGYDLWDDIGADMKVELENTDCDNQTGVLNQTPHSFWVATVQKVCGYKALVRYEGFDDESHDFWVNLCSSEVHAVGWCATRGKPLIPPKTIANKYSDWKEFLVGRLSGAITLPSNFYNKISDSFKSRFRCGLNLEIVDKNRISQVKLATVHKIVGKRLFVKYFDADEGFWCHEDSQIIHPVGWATTVGHKLSAPQNYLERMRTGRQQMIELLEDDAQIELFKMNFTFEEYINEKKTERFTEGMKLEAIDPLNLSSICVATVMSVLKFGYMMIRIDSYDVDKEGNDWFCYHEKSPCIFPVGFCKRNNINLTPPYDFGNKTFQWEKYLQDTCSLPTSEHLFHSVIPNHGFKPGMRLECADLMDPRLICVATISRIVGRLVKVRFDGWTEEYDQWLDCESPDFYPVGWCVLVGHKLEGPPNVTKQQQVTKSVKNTRKKRRKKQKNDNTNTSKTIGRPPNIKKELQQESTNKQSNNNIVNDRVNIKTEMKFEPNDEDDGDDDYEDDISRSDQSTPLPPTPEPGDKSRSASTISVQSSNSVGVVVKTTSASPAPPPERKATSYINNSSVTSSKYIPRLTDSNNSSESGGGGGAGGTQVGELIPETWNVHDVSQFLRINDCIAHCDTFSRNKIDGKRLLQLSKDEIITFFGMKVGPALKIFDLIQQLKCKVNPTKSRLMKANINKKFL